MRARVYRAYPSIRGHWTLRCMSRCPNQVFSLMQNPQCFSPEFLHGHGVPSPKLTRPLTNANEREWEGTFRSIRNAIVTAFRNAASVAFAEAGIEGKVKYRCASGMLTNSRISGQKCILQIEFTGHLRGVPSKWLNSFK
ncbi:hypothetical protein TNCV_258951 [Trichonephila clavipes]|uniref:Uncharacterized protein n=1 Tax=Trichonephila clavipes TaxID=2585209 RepID=A0A8X6V9Y8_TRICX|nr:hypothetical protein TNCV_258951 [Trichonephila clavipes]